MGWKNWTVGLVLYFKINHALLENNFFFLRFLGTMRGHVQAVYMICWSADSRLLVSGSADSTLKGLYFSIKPNATYISVTIITVFFSMGRESQKITR